MQGDPIMFEPFWKEFGDNVTVVIPGWQKMSYFSERGNLCCFLEPEFANEALPLHRIVNNAVTDSRHLIVIVGSTQLVHAIGVSKDSQVRAAKILKVISDGFEFPHPLGVSQFFHFGWRMLADMWWRLHQDGLAFLVFSLQFCEFLKEHAETYPGFAWIRCEHRIKDCEAYFKTMNALTISGRRFGAGAEFTRISMLDMDENFDIFIKRISY